MDSAVTGLGSILIGGSRKRQWALAGGIAAILFALLLATYYALRPSYQVLFKDLKAQDAAAIVAELDKQKVPYRIDESTSAILVPEGDTRAMRLKLMSSDLRLQGVVGLELFNNSDLGLTEFSQKVNYQRALQGELARTIMTLDEIDLARVHLTLPESSLFRRDVSRPKASVALFVRNGQTLQPDTIQGIRRLVAAAVADLAAADVTVLDQRGDLAAAREGDLDDPKYALKQALERSYEQKILTQITPIIDGAQASVSVAVDLNFDQRRATRESDTRRPATESDGKPSRTSSFPSLPTSADKQERISSSLPPLPEWPPVSSDGSRTERTLEQIVSEPGAIQRLSVGIVLDKPLSADEQKRIESVLSASLGLDTKRGDVLSIYVHRPASRISEERAAMTSAPVVTMDPVSMHSADAHDAPVPTATHDQARALLGNLTAAQILGLTVALVLMTGLALGGLVRTLARRGRRPVRRLTERQRQDYVLRLRALLATEEGGDGHS